MAATKILIGVLCSVTPGAGRDAEFRVIPSGTQSVTALLDPFRGKHPVFYENQKSRKHPSLLFAVTSFPREMSTQGSVQTAHWVGGRNKEQGKE